MLNKIKTFFNADDGAVTVDWVVLTAAVVGFAGAIYTSIHGGATSVATGVSTAVSNVTPDTGM
jgi:hypothetical protein